MIGYSDGSVYEDEMNAHLGIPVAMNANEEPITMGDEPKDTNLFFVRHGETTENAKDNVRGWEPVSLNDKGKKQALTVAKQLKNSGVTAIVSSDLQRAKETAHIIGGKLGIVPQFDSRLRTWNVGDIAGTPCAEGNPELAKYVEDKPDEPVPGGESFNDFKDRAFDGIRSAILENRGEKLAILSHNRVEATVRAWEKTGQDNPSIDPKEVNKEAEQPGSVERFRMSKDSTIMNPPTSFNDRFNAAGNFNERFQGQQDTLPIAAPGEKFYSDWPDQGGSLEGGRNVHISTPRGEIIPKTEQMVATRSADPNAQPAQFDIKQFIPKRLQGPISEWLEGMGDAAKKQIEHIIAHPEELPSTEGLGGMARPLGSFKNIDMGMFKRLQEQGLNLDSIAKELGVTTKTLYNAREREGYKLGPQGPKDKSEPRVLEPREYGYAERQRDKIFDLKNREGLKTSEIAERLGMPFDTVDSILHK